MFRLVTALAFLLATSAAGFARPIHIVAFGDSATAGYLVPRENAYPAQLQTALRQKGHDVEVVNAGVSGDTTAGALKRLDMAIGPDTDIALVEFGTNDLRLRLPALKMRANLREIVRTLRRRGIEVLLIGLGRLDLGDVARAENVAYAQWQLPAGKFHARDGAHFNAHGYAILVARLLPQVEALIARRQTRAR
jgi:acyl-CoA thioesterase-1